MIFYFAGIYEALELRDKVKADWHGKGVTKAIANVNDVIAPALVKENLDPVEQVCSLQDFFFHSSSLFTPVSFKQHSRLELVR